MEGFPEKDDHNERKQGAEEREKREYEAPAEKDGEFSPDNRRHAGPDAEKNCNEGENPGGFNPLPLIAHNAWEITGPAEAQSPIRKRQP